MALRTFETLEARVMMAADIGFDADAALVMITGTGERDVVEVRYIDGGRVEVSVRGGPSRSFNTARVDSIEFLGKAGDDAFFNRTRIDSLAKGGRGNDVLRGGSLVDRLFGQHGRDRLNGGWGFDVQVQHIASGLPEPIYRQEFLTAIPLPVADQLQGGAGHDRIVADRYDQVVNPDRGKDKVVREGDVLHLPGITYDSDGFTPARLAYVEVTVPTGGYQLSIRGAYVVGEEIWVVSELESPPPGTGTTQALMTRRDMVYVVDAPKDLPVKYVVVGGRGWNDSPDYRFVDSFDAIADELAGATELDISSADFEVSLFA